MQSVVFLGLIVDFELAQFRVQEKRLGLIRRQLTAALENPGSLMPGDIASIAYRIHKHTKMAVPVAPLLCWDLYKAIKTTSGSPKLVRTLEEIRDILVFLCLNYEA